MPYQPYHQRHAPLSARHLGDSERRAESIEHLVAQFRYLEDLLLLWSIPALIAVFLLWSVGSSVQGELQFLTQIINLLVTLLTLAMACLLFLKWIDILQAQGMALLRKKSDETTLNFALACCTCLLLVGLIIGTAQAGGGDSRIALQILIFALLGWHYRTHLKRIPHSPVDTTKKL